MVSKKIKFLSLIAVGAMLFSCRLLDRNPSISFSSGEISQSSSTEDTSSEQSTSSDDVISSNSEETSQSSSTGDTSSEDMISSSDITSSVVDNNKSDEEVATEAISVAIYIGEVDLDNVNGRISLVSQAVVARSKDEAEDSFETISINWTADNPSKWNFEVYNELNLIFATPIQEHYSYDFTLTASVTVGNVTKTKTISGTVSAKIVDSINLSSISELNENHLNTIVTVEGYVFSHPKRQNTGFYLTDGASFVFVYDGAKNVVTKGNKVKVTGNFVKYGSYSQMYQIDCGSTVTGATVTITDTATNELPVDGATEFDLNNSSTFSKTRLGVAGELKVYHVKSYLVGYVNSYGNPSYELCTTSDGSGKYLAWHPGSVDCFSIYGEEYGTFDTSAPTTHKEGIVNDGQLHDFYFVIYDADMENDNVALFNKYRFIPICYR